jgi:hypothetical protein
MLVNGSKHIALFPGDSSNWITIHKVANGMVTFSFENSDFTNAVELDIVVWAICAVPASIRFKMLKASAQC